MNQNKKKILIVCLSFYPSNIGGPSKTLYDIATSLVKKEYPVTVVSSSLGINENQIVPNAWVNIGGIHAIYCTSRTRISHRILYHAIREIKTHDVIYINSFFFFPSLFTAIFAKWNNKKIIWSPRGETMAPNKKRYKLIWIKLIKILFARDVIFHATTEIEKKDIQYYLGEDASVYVIPNYLYVPPIMPRKSSEPYFLFAGRIAPIKKIENIIEALVLSKQYINSGYKFKIAGPIEDKYAMYYQKLKEIIQKNSLTDRVIFVGNLQGNEKYQAYRDAECLLLVSSSENFGNVVVESLSQGTPVIASLGTPWSVLTSVNAGYYVDNAPESLATVIDEFLSLSEFERLKMRDAAYKLAKEYTIEGNITQWTKLVD